MEGAVESHGYPHLPGPPLSLPLARRLLNYPKLPLYLIREHALMFAYYYGQLAGAADTRRAAGVVKRYYAAAAAGDARTACSLLVPALAKGLPNEYGHQGPSYLRGANTCQSLLSRVFRRAHPALTLPITVRGLLAHGDTGYAFVNSKKLPVSVVELQRKHGSWVVDSAIGVPMSLNGVTPVAPWIGL